MDTVRHYYETKMFRDKTMTNTSVAPDAMTWKWQDTSWKQESTGRTVREWEVDSSTHDSSTADGPQYFFKIQVQYHEEGNEWVITGYKDIMWAGFPDVDEVFYDKTFSTCQVAMEQAMFWDFQLWMGQE